MPRLPPVKRWDIISLHKLGASNKSISRQLVIGLKSVRRWIARFRETNNCEPLKPKGRPTLLSEETALHAVKILIDRPGKSAKHVSKELVELGVTPAPLHPSTLARTAHRVAQAQGRKLLYRRKKPVKGLSEKNKDHRLAFVAANWTRGWKTTMFTDRKKFNFKYPGEKVHKNQWVWKDEDAPTAREVNHPDCVNLYAGLTYYGTTKVHIVSGTSKQKKSGIKVFTNLKGQAAKNITCEEYKEVVSKTLLPEGRRLFTQGAGVSTWTIMQDNDPSHKRAVRNIHESMQGASLLESWPPNSPDLNPIENLWAWVEGEVEKLGCRTFEEFKVAVIKHVENPPRKLCERLIGSMRRRLEAVRHCKGARTKY
jgi:transposase